LAVVQDAFPHVDIGSYPQFKQNAGWGVSVVLRSVEADMLDRAQAMLVDALSQNGISLKIM